MKRETSVSVSDLQDLTSINDSVKRLALLDRSSASSLPPSSPTPQPGAPQSPVPTNHSGPGPGDNITPINLSPAGSIDRANSDSPTGSSSGYISSEQIHPPPQRHGIYPPIAPLFHPSQIRMQQSGEQDGGFANGRTFSQGGTVLESICDRNDFANKYDVMREIGRGGFSTVFQCKQKATQMEYAVKIVDLRPLRLREKFNPARLRREVDIMKRLRHPNIVEFIEGFETEEQLLMVMELCPGEELFDVILARQKFSEIDAKPVFAQVAHALYYLHCLNIIHRDVKPENILILHRRDSRGNAIAKLLDFGLSKNAGAGSAAKTFVGTPCYLSPEVEYTSKGLGGTYGLPADCWSLGAVLYVMLVARFPEFEHDAATDKIVLKLPAPLWDGISPEARHLVRSLMNTSPNARLTTRETLLHPWLGAYRSSQQELDALQLASYDLGQNLQEEAEIEASRMEQEGQAEEEYEEITAGGIAVHRHAMVLRNNAQHSNNGTSSLGVDQLQLAPLLRLQRSIAYCFAEAHSSYQDYPEVATQVRRGAALCRDQFTESNKMLSKVEQTAQAVLELFPDLILAVEDGEPQLAAEFFNIVRGWVVDLRELVANTQKANRASMAQIQTIVERSTVNLQSRAKARERKAARTFVMPKRLLDMVRHARERTAPSGGGAGSSNSNSSSSSSSSSSVGGSAGGNGTGSESDSSGSGAGGEEDAEALTPEQVLDLFMGLFGQSPSAGSSGGVSPSLSNGGSNGSLNNTMSRSDGGDWDQDGMVDDVDCLSSDSITLDDSYEMSVGASNNGFIHQDNSNAVDMMNTVAAPVSSSSAVLSLAPLMIPPHQADTNNNNNSSLAASSSPVAASRLAEALHKLRQVDMILEQLSVFWANTEVVLDMLTKKGQHVEKLIGFSQKPRLMARFQERMLEYKRFWEGVRTLCNNYASGVHQGNSNSPSNNYSFLDGGGLGGSSSGSSSSSTSANADHNYGVGTMASGAMFQELIRGTSGLNLPSSSTHTHTTAVTSSSGRVDKLDSL